MPNTGFILQQWLCILLWNKPAAPTHQEKKKLRYIVFKRSAHNLLSTLACFEDELVGKIVNFSLSFPTPHETYRQLNKPTHCFKCIFQILLFLYTKIKGPCFHLVRRLKTCKEKKKKKEKKELNSVSEISKLNPELKLLTSVSVSSKKTVFGVL